MVTAYNFKNQHFVGEEGRLIPLLQQAQTEDGYLRRERLEEIHRESGIPLAHIYGVATFYAQFRLKPVGKYLLRVCHGTACHVSGAVELSQAVEKHLGIPNGETTPDRLFSIETVSCLGCCSLAPVDDDQQRDVRQPEPVGRREDREEVPEGGAVMTRVTVGLSTCGIAAGAEDTYRALETKLAGLPDAPELTRTGCVGMCYQEPLVEISNGDGARYLYGHVSPDKVDRLLDEHVRQGHAGRRLAGLDERRQRLGHAPTSRASTASCCATAATSTRSRSTTTSRSGGYQALQQVLDAEGPRRR